jgi:adenine deaminase
LSIIRKMISVAKGDSPADLVLTNARIVNTLSGEIERGSVAVYRGRIAGVGDYRQAKEIIDLRGRYLAPGLINGHTHLESSMLDVGQYARAVVTHGTAAIVTDLHEIANITGMEGITYVLDSARRLPLDLFLMAPSCVPATHLETSGAVITAADIRRMLRWRDCIGLGEMMNYPGVLAGDSNVLDKIASVGNRPVDGHAPGLSGRDLAAYIAAGIGSDHESVTLEEAEEKLRRGMFVMIREGSTEKNLEDLLPLVTDKTWQRCMFVVDDRSCVDLRYDGDIDALVRKAVRLGLEPVRAIQMATINPAGYFKLNHYGAIAPGYYANIMVLDDLSELIVNEVFYRGRLVARDGKALFPASASGSRRLLSTMNIKPFTRDAFRLKAAGDSLPVIEVVPGQIVTRKKSVKVTVNNGEVVADTERDILKIAVVERHRASGNIGLGLIAGFGLKRGALASSVAHDSHNIVVVGAGDEDMYVAVKEIEKTGGSLVVAAGGRVLDSLALPVAGILADRPLETVVDELERLQKSAVALGTSLPAPFAALSFMALPVIPEIRLTDLGLVDVNDFKLIK